MSSPRILRALTALIAGLMAIPVGVPFVHAADTESLINAGLELRKLRKDREALVLFERAVEQQPTPRGLAHLGICEQSLGLWTVAERHIEGALKGDNDPWIIKNRNQLQQSLTYVKGKLGQLEIWGFPAGANVVIDDVKVGTLPLTAPIRVSGGRRTITVEASGYVTDTRTVLVQAGTTFREHFALARAPSHWGQAGTNSRRKSDLAASTAQASGATTPAIASPPKSTAASRQIDPAADKFYGKWWFWTAVAATVAAGGVAAFLILRNDGECNYEMGAPCW